MNSDVAIRFLSHFFARAQGDVYISSLPNERGQQPPERHIITRDSEKVARFCEKWDQIGRGLFFCIATLRPGAQPTERGSLRCKANVAELPGIHVDIDFNTILAPDDNPQAYVISKLESLKIPPSITVASGGGVHAYWMLDRPINDMERAERLMRTMAALVAGDPAVCEVARLMRLPGSTNSKREEPRPAALLKLSDGSVDVEALEDMAKGEPVIAQAGREKAPVPDTPAARFEAVAALSGFKPPIDVEERLAAMRHEGSGESGVHVTQRDVTASLITAGMSLEDAVERVFQATKAVAPAGWNMQHERDKIKHLALSWQVKRATMAKLVSEVTSDPESNVVQMVKPKPKAPTTDKPNFPRIVSDSIVEIIRERGHDIMLAGGHCHLYRNGTWSAKNPADEQELKVLIQEGFEALGQPGDVRLLNAAWKRLTEHPGLFRSDPAWDKHSMIPTLSGLVDPMTGELHPATPEHFCTWRVDAEYDPTASCPMWADMIDETFADRSPDERRDTVCVIQEMIGTALVDGLKRQLSKGMILHGGEDCGKSEILKVISGLFRDKLITASFDVIEKSPHGLMEFVKRAPWVLHEAFQQGKWQLSAIVKSIVTHNPVSINVKNGPIFTQIVRAPIFWGTNHPPQFKEMTRAIVSRFIIIACKQKFKEDAPVGVAVKARTAGFQEPSDLVLAKERSGILNWAIRGLQRAMARGWIEQTAGMREAGEEVRRDSNLVSGFVEDHVVFDRTSMVSVPDFCLAFQPWFAQHKGDARTRPSNESVGRAVAALGDPRIGIHNKELRDKNCRYYAGIRLDKDALKFWEREKAAQNFNPTAVFLSESVDDVNREIPASWGDRSSVVICHRAHSRGDSSPSMTVGVTVNNVELSPTQPSDSVDDIPF